jgi:FdhE protein
MTVDYGRRIARAEELAVVHPESAELLGFYCGLARIQRELFKALVSSGETDVRALARHFPTLIDYADRAAPQHLSAFGRERLGGSLDRENLLTGYWQGDRTAPLEAQFFARVLLQSYAESLAERAPQSDLGQHTSSATCPLCSAKPVVAVLRGEGDGAKRSLMCSLCSTEWPYRRIVCANCGEENKDRLPVFAPEAGHVSVNACDSCQCYLKSVDLTKDGHAVPVVDELATVSLNIWAEEHGYVKLEVNLLGM